MPKCPQCGGELDEVRQQSPKMYNNDQFEAMIAGNYYCTTCPDNGRGKTGYCYFWKSELKKKMSESRMILNEQLMQIVIENVGLLKGITIHYPAEDEYIHSDDYYSEISRMLDTIEDD